MTGPVDPERAARALLMAVAEPAEPRLNLAVEGCGAAEVVGRLREGTIELPGSTAMRVRLRDRCGAAELAAGAALGARLVVPGEAGWPARLDDLGPVRPLALWCRGARDLLEAAADSVALVGSRAATSYGVHVAGGFGAELAERGWTVVSGCAFGIDAAAHRGALAVRGRTLGVLAGGIDVPYPQAHATLIRRIADDGLLLSESGLGAAPARRRFLTRNRIIAALTGGTVVVEAASRSGAATTARWAGDLHRVLMAVPGPITSAVSVGCHELLRTGQAVAVTRTLEVIEAVGRFGTDAVAPRAGESRPLEELERPLRELLEAFPARGAIDVGRLGVVSGQDQATVCAGLGELSVVSLVERVDGGWRLTRAGRGLPARAERG